MHVPYFVIVQVLIVLEFCIVHCRLLLVHLCCKCYCLTCAKELLATMREEDLGNVLDFEADSVKGT